MEKRKIDLFNNVTKWRMHKTLNEEKSKSTNDTLKIFETKLRSFMEYSKLVWVPLKHNDDVIGYYHFYLHELPCKRNEDEAMLRFFAQALQKSHSQKNFTPADMLRQYKVVMKSLRVTLYERRWKFSPPGTSMPKYNWNEMMQKVGQAALEPMAL